MLISSASTSRLIERLEDRSEIYCSGLYLSARWFVLSQAVSKGNHLIVLPTQEAAEYCAADLYNLVNGDNVFYFPSSGKGIEKSNYKSTLQVQRTSAIGKILSSDSELSIFVSYPEALQEQVPDKSTIDDSIIKLKVGDEISYEKLKKILSENGFEKTDFVSSPGQYALRGSVVDIFSYSSSFPYRLSFWGDEIEEINSFDCNTQLSKEKTDSVEIISSIVSDGESSSSVNICDILPDDIVVWLDSSDMYSNKDFFKLLEKFKRVFIDSPISADPDEKIYFFIKPQPVFNKNFELLAEDIRSKIENGYKVFIYGEKKSQLERVKSILIQNGGLVPEFVKNSNIHNGFIDSENKVC